MYGESKESQWYIDSGCSKHMAGDHSKFISLNKEKKGNVTFGNDIPAKINGKGIINLRNERTNVEDVSLVEGLTYNLLSVNEICDQGHILTFNSKNSEIRKKRSGKLVAVTIRTPNNVYILNKMDK